MALRQGQREVRIEEDIVRAALKDQPRGNYINLDEKIVGVSYHQGLGVPSVVIFLVEKIDAKEGS